MGRIINLNKTFSTILKPAAPYNFDATLHKPSHFPSSDNIWEGGKYWITMVWKGNYLGLKLENKINYLFKRTNIERIQTKFNSGNRVEVQF